MVTVMLFLVHASYSAQAWSWNSMVYSLVPSCTTVPDLPWRGFCPNLLLLFIHLELIFLNILSAVRSLWFLHLNLLKCATWLRHYQGTLGQWNFKLIILCLVACKINCFKVFICSKYYVYLQKMKHMLYIHEEHWIFSLFLLSCLFSTQTKQLVWAISNTMENWRVLWLSLVPWRVYMIPVMFSTGVQSI